MATATASLAKRSERTRGYGHCKTQLSIHFVMNFRCDAMWLQYIDGDGGAYSIQDVIISGENKHKNSFGQFSFSCSSSPPQATMVLNDG